LLAYLFFDKSRSSKISLHFSRSAAQVFCYQSTKSVW